MTTLVGILVTAALFAVFGLTQRGHRCDGACPGCGTGCSHWVAPGEQRDMEVTRVGR